MFIIVDSGVANVGSVANMMHRIGVAARVSNDLEVIARADRLVLPGVGSFDGALSAWMQSGLVDALNKAVKERAVPCLGICLGMQVMAHDSEEGSLPGLGWIDAEVIRFRPDADNTVLRIPHMGWNTVHPVRESTVFEGLAEEPRFYFVHSYHVVCNDPNDVLATSEHGMRFVCAIQHANIIGVQFHPEKSHKYGMRLLENFARWNP